MLASLIITFRETLEAALIVGLILSYLKRTNQNHFIPTIFIGVFVAILTSLAGAWAFSHFLGGFSGDTEAWFEGVTMIVGAILITSLLIWVAAQKPDTNSIANKLKEHTDNAAKIKLFTLVFVLILREGIELSLIHI